MSRSRNKFKMQKYYQSEPKFNSVYSKKNNEITGIMKVISQEEEFLSFLKPLLTAGLPLLKNVLTPLAKSVLISLGLIAAATDASTQKKIYGSGTTALIISNEEMGDIIKIVKSLEESGLVIKVISETIKNEAKEQKGSYENVMYRNVTRYISC